MPRGSGSTAARRRAARALSVAGGAGEATVAGATQQERRAALTAEIAAAKARMEELETRLMGPLNARDAALREEEWHAGCPAYVDKMLDEVKAEFGDAVPAGLREDVIAKLAEEPTQDEREQFGKYYDPAWHVLRVSYRWRGVAEPIWLEYSTNMSHAEPIYSGDCSAVADCLDWEDVMALPEEYRWMAIVMKHHVMD